MTLKIQSLERTLQKGPITLLCKDPVRLGIRHDLILLFLCLVPGVNHIHSFLGEFHVTNYALYYPALTYTEPEIEDSAPKRRREQGDQSPIEQSPGGDIGYLDIEGGGRTRYVAASHWACICAEVSPVTSQKTSLGNLLLYLL